MAKEQNKNTPKGVGKVPGKPAARKTTPKSKKPVFKRFKDESRPSDFGATSKSEKTFGSKPSRVTTNKSFKKPSSPKPSFKKTNPEDINEKDLEYEKVTQRGGRNKDYKRPTKRPIRGRKTSSTSTNTNKEEGAVRLNKYLSNAGICSRREADELIATGVVKVNGKTITEMGFQVKPTDIVNYGGQTLKKERHVYLVLNKPKDYITTADDPKERKIVLDLIRNACKERIYPVGRLDRATTGLLMFTNDGELTKRLTHPRYGVKKIYHVVLDKPLSRADMLKISEGLILEDGPIKVDEIVYVGNGKNKTEIGVEIHSGKNRIVRRIFSHMGYNVRKLDRVVFGSLTKKDLPRGRWRMLSEAEVGMLKMISSD